MLHRTEAQMAVEAKNRRESSTAFAIQRFLVGRCDDRKVVQRFQFDFWKNYRRIRFRINVFRFLRLFGPRARFIGGAFLDFRLRNGHSEGGQPLDEVGTIFPMIVVRGSGVEVTAAQTLEPKTGAFGRLDIAAFDFVYFVFVGRLEFDAALAQMGFPVFRFFDDDVSVRFEFYRQRDRFLGNGVFLPLLYAENQDARPSEMTFEI